MCFKLAFETSNLTRKLRRLTNYNLYHGFIVLLFFIVANLMANILDIDQ